MHELYTFSATADNKELDVINRIPLVNAENFPT